MPAHLNHRPLQQLHTLAYPNSYTQGVTASTPSSVASSGRSSSFTTNCIPSQFSTGIPSRSGASRSSSPLEVSLVQAFILAFLCPGLRSISVISVGAWLGALGASLGPLGASLGPLLGLAVGDGPSCCVALKKPEGVQRYRVILAAAHSHHT